MNNEQSIIDSALIHNLLTTQFLQWQNLAVQLVVPGGWDNKTFHLGQTFVDAYAKRN